MTNTISKPKRKHCKIPEINTYILFAIIYLLAMSFLFLFFRPAVLNIDETEYTEESIRIEKISHDLAEASSELSNIQEKLEGRIKYVESLKKEAEIAENVISLSDEQVTAIQAKLNQELEESSGKGFIQSIFISAVFFILGLIVQPTLNAIKGRFDKNPMQDTSAPYNFKYSEEQIEQAIKLFDMINQSKN